MGKTTSRTGSSGCSNAASAMRYRMRVFPATRLRSLIYADSTRRSARAPMRWTIWINNVTRASVTRLVYAETPGLPGASYEWHGGAREYAKEIRRQCVGASVQLTWVYTLETGRVAIRWYGASAIWRSRSGHSQHQQDQ